MPGLLDDPRRQYSGLLPQPALPGSDIQGAIAGLLHGMFVQPVQDAGRALAGGMTDAEAQDFAFGAALGAIPAGRAGKAVKAAAKALPMDEASRMARADAMGFRRAMPLLYGSAPEGEKITGAAIKANDRIFTGPNHFDAVMAAEREIGVPFEQMNLAPIMDGFTTTGGRYVSRWEAGDIARRAGQGETGGIFGATRGLASEDAAMSAPKANRSRVRTGATEPGLPGGQGLWGSLLPVESNEAGALWHRAAHPATMEARGLPDHEIQANLIAAWERGNDAVMLKNYIRPGGEKPETIIVVRDMNQLRSPNAAFDPAKKDSGNVLASIAAALGVPAGAVALAGPDTAYAAR